MGGSAGGSGDPGDVFDRSLEDFDGEIGREREAIAQAGKGSGGSAAGRQSSDRAVVSRGGGAGGMGDMGGAGGTGGMGGFPGGMSGRMPGGMTGTGPGGDQEPMAGGTRSGSGAGAPGDDSRDGEAEGTEAGEDAGRGQTQVRNPNPGGDVEKSDRDGGRVASIPEDIQANTGAEDQVARQLKEAAMAETDPVIRDALWDEYRRHMGMKRR